MADPGDPSAARSERRGLLARLATVRAELLLTVVAVVASAAASTAALLETRTLGDQLSASVWPYLTYDLTFEGGRAAASSIGVRYVNEGLGPALVRTFAVSVDGKPVRNWHAAMTTLDPRGVPVMLAEGDFGGGTVLRPGDSRSLVRMRDPKLGIAGFPDLVARVRTVACYCSLLGDCWTLDSRGVEPRRVRSCGAPTAKFAD